MPSDQGKLRSVFIAMAVLLLASAVTIFYAGHRAISANEQIVARQAAIDDLQSLFSTIQDAETGQRGYLLTGEEIYLAPYESARRRVHGHMAKVRERVDGGL